jgi:heme-degrading monooxygenase HmoA
MIARVWHGVVPVEKADAYGRYLAEGERGVRDYQGTPGNRGAFLLRGAKGDRVHFLLISLWQSREAIQAYAGPDIERARYFPYDLECLIDPEASVTHYEVLAASAVGHG